MCSEPLLSDCPSRSTCPYEYLVPARYLVCRSVISFMTRWHSLFVWLFNLVSVISHFPVILSEKLCQYVFPCLYVQYRLWVC